MPLTWDRRSESGYKGTTTRAAVDDDVEGPPIKGEDGSVLLLRTSGCLMERRSSLPKRIAQNGLMRELRNYPQRNKEWAFSCSCSNPRTGEMAFADARGQVYILSASDNVYHAVRLASSSVSCLGFVASRADELIIAYENGTVICIDTRKKAIIGNMQQTGSSPIRMVRSHPTRPSAILVSDDKVVSFWSLTKWRCTKSFESEEAVVDIRYEANGALTVMALQQSGLFLYRTGDFELLQRCPLPTGERSPNFWLAYCSHSLQVVRDARPSADAPPSQAAQKSEFQQAEFHLRVLLSADNGMVYVWNAVFTKKSLMNRGSAEDEADEEGDEESGVLNAALVGVLELPVTMKKAVALVPLGLVRRSSRQARILVLGDDGALLLVEVEEASISSLGSWAVTLSMSPQVLFGCDAAGLAVRPFAVGTSSSSSSSSEEEKVDAAAPVLDGKLSAHGEAFLAVGADKAVRRFDADSALGLGELSGTLLRSRAPHTNVTRRPDYWMQIQDMKSSRSLGGSASVGRAKKTYSALGQGVEELEGGSTARLFPWSAASGAGAGLASSLASQATDYEALGPPPPYMSQSLSSTTVANLKAGEAAKLPPATGGESPKSLRTHRRVESKQEEEERKRKEEEELDQLVDQTLPRQERALQREMLRQQREKALRKAEEESQQAAKYAEEMRAHQQSAAAAKVKREAEKAERVRARAEASAQRREAKLARLAQLEAEGISSRATELFELADLTPAEREANVKKLRAFVEAHGEFPPKYRNLIWRFLLQLPENVDAFAALRSRGSHAVFETLAQTYPIPDTILADRLQALCSQLVHWSPILGEAKFLPQLVFPLVAQFGHDDLSAFETAATMLMWWGHTWMSGYPSDPAHIVETLDALVAAHDTKLRYHFSTKVNGVTAGQLGWAMLSTGFAEVLSKADWLKLMDFLFANFRHPGLFLLAPVAILRNVRASLLTTESASVVELFCRRLQGVDIAEVVADIKSMLLTTPSSQLAVLVPRRLVESGKEVAYVKGGGALGGKARSAMSDDDDYDAEEDESDFARKTEPEEPVVKVPDGQQAAVFPLPRAAAYPKYNCFPAHVLEWQLRDRVHSDNVRKELRHKEALLHSLQQRTTELRGEHEAWMARHGNTGDTEAARRLALMESEVRHMRELLRIEEAIASERVEALAVLEKVAEAELEVLDATTTQAKQLVQSSEAHLDEKTKIAMSMAKHRELAETAEATTEDRIRTLRLRRTREERIKALGNALRDKEQELDALDAVQAEEWKRQDEELGRRRAERAKRAEQLLEEEALGSLQDDLAARMQRLALEREARLLEMERARAVRIAREQTDEALEAAERSALLMQKHELALTTEKAAQLASAGHRMTHDLLLKTAGHIREESSRLVEAERVYVARQQRARVAARGATLEREWAEKQTGIMVGVISSEQELQEQVLRLSRASAETEAEEALVLEQTRIYDEAGRGGAGARLEELGERVMGQQRQRFDEMKRALSSAEGPRM